MPVPLTLRGMWEGKHVEGTALQSAGYFMTSWRERFWVEVKEIEKVNNKDSCWGRTKGTKEAIGSLRPERQNNKHKAFPGRREPG